MSEKISAEQAREILISQRLSQLRAASRGVRELGKRLANPEEDSEYLIDRIQSATDKMDLLQAEINELRTRDVLSFPTAETIQNLRSAVVALEGALAKARATRTMVSATFAVLEAWPVG